MANVARIQELIDLGRRLPARAPDLPAAPSAEDYARHYAELATLFANGMTVLHQTLPLMLEEIIDLHATIRVGKSRRPKVRSIR